MAFNLSSFFIFACSIASFIVDIELSYTSLSTGYGNPSFPPCVKLYFTGSLQLAGSPYTKSEIKI